MKKGKKILSVVLTMLIILSAVPLLSSYATDSISIGDTITLGTYNGEPITWICVDIDDNGPLMLSEEVLCNKQYDAAGTSSTYHTDGWGYIRKNYGSNCWYDSSIRQWLNTSGTVNYTHCPPNYSSEAGFMSNFTMAELSVVKSVTQKTYVNSWEKERNGYVDGGSQEVPDSYNITGLNKNYSSYWYQNVTDSFFLLAQEQLYNIYSNNPDYVYSGTEYYTRIAGNNGASYEHVFGVNGKNSIRALRAYETKGIRPAFYLDVENWESREQFPDGYDFDEDSYSFYNGKTTISKKYFTTLFGEEQGKLLYKKKKKAGGVCFGMAYTTAAFYTGLPTYNNIRSLNTKSTITIGNNILSLYDYIVYSYIYQYSTAAREQIEPTKVSIPASKLYNTVKALLNDNILVPITMWHLKLNSNNKWDITSGHTVLAVGIDGNDILVDDPNKIDDVERITVNGDDWSFSAPWETDGVGGHNSTLCYSLDIQMPYKILSTGTHTIVYEPIINKDSTTAVSGETYIEGIEKLDTDKLLMLVDSESYCINTDNLTEISNEIGAEEDFSTNSDNLYWVHKDKSITISDIVGDSNEIIVAGNDVSISVKTQDTSEVTLTVDEEDENVKAEIDCIKGNMYTVSFGTTDNNESDLSLAISGTASDTTITATQTETGLLVTGISDGTVTLTKDEEVIATQEITNAVSDIEINYDTDGASDDLTVDYHTHAHTSTETKAPTCTEKGELTYTCSCNDTYTEEIAINPVNHIGETEIRNSKDATCTEKGYTGDTYCLDCGEMISAGKETNINGHKNSDGNNTCDICSETLEDCSHICHKTGFLGFIWKIIRFFCKLFKCRPVCDCGIAHY